MLNFWQKFSLLLWKNWCVQWNNRWHLIFSLLSPVLFCTIMILIRCAIQVKEIPMTKYERIAVEETWTDVIHRLAHRKQIINKEIPSFTYNNFIPRPVVGYAPSTCERFRNIMTGAINYLDETEIVGFANCETLRRRMIAEDYIAGVCFDKCDVQNLTETIYLSNELEYSLLFPSELRFYKDSYVSSSWKTNILYDRFDKSRSHSENPNDGGVDYIREGFIGLQNAVAMSYIRLVATSDIKWPTMYIQRFPRGQHFLDGMDEASNISLSLIILLGFFYPVLHLIGYIVGEKENQMKLVMSINGINNFTYFISWIISGLIWMFFGSILMTCVLKIHWFEGRGIVATGSFLPFLFFMLSYNMASVCYCLMMSSIFSRTKTAYAVSGIIWFITYLPYVVTQNEIMLSVYSRLLMYMFSNTSMALGIDCILEYEMYGNGFGWTGFVTPISFEKKWVVGEYALILYALSGVYVALGLLIRKCKNLMPTLFRSSVKIEKRIWKKRNAFAPPSPTASRLGKVYEIVSESKNVTVEIKKLTKRYHGVTVVDQISLNLYENEITVLMGHNGCGKTTLISMLIGMIEPTEGTATIKGVDIFQHRRQIGGILSCCMSNSMLFEDLTVVDQLRFFSRIKGLSKEDTETEVEKYVNAMQMQDHMDTLTRNLTSGLKQHLAVCCALVGHSQVVLLVEPDRGLDFTARKLLVEMLLKEKIGRSILMTTHSTDTANTVADRVAIMSNGELRCNGSIYFLKNMYAQGHRLLCIKGRHCETEAVTEIVEKYIPYIRPESDIGTELTYTLDDKYTRIFEKLLDELEDKSVALDLEGCTILETDLDDIFIRMGIDASGEIDSSRQSEILNGRTIDADEYERLSFLAECEHVRGVRLWLNHLKAMLLKRYIFGERYKMIAIVQILMPILFIILSFLVTYIDIERDKLKALQFHLNQYEGSLTLVETTPRVSDFGSRIAEEYLEYIFWLSNAHQTKTTDGELLSTYLLNNDINVEEPIHNKYLIGATFGSDYVTAWFNNYPLHSVPLSLNMMHNALVRAVTNDYVHISVSIDPLPYSCHHYATLKRNPVNIGTLLPINLAFCACFMSATCIFFLLKERQSHFKLMQFLSGVHILTFWLTTFLYDIIKMTIRSAIIVFVIFLYQHHTFRRVSVWYFTTLVASNVCVYPGFYLLSSFFHTPLAAYSAVVCINVFGIIGFWAFVVATNNNMTTVATTLHWTFRLFPYYSYCNALVKIFHIGEIEQICADENCYLIATVLENCTATPNCCSRLKIWSYTDGIIPDMLSLVITGITCGVILNFCEVYRVWGRQSFGLRPPDDSFEMAYEDHKRRHESNPILQEDDDVVRERMKVMGMRVQDRAKKMLVCDRLTKLYGNVAAVNRLCICIERGECFGIIGTNGSGKSTLLRMLVGDLSISFGRAFVEGISVTDDLSKIYERIGYSPQDNSLLAEYTPAEIMKIVCLLRGMSSHQIDDRCTNLAKVLGFYKDYHKKLGIFSSGNRKRLSCAIAMLGNPSLIYLDETTTSIDRAGRRQLWNIINILTNKGKSVLMTSSNPRARECICHRLAIMTNGRLLNIGTPGELNRKFAGGGFLLEVKLKAVRNYGRSFALKRQADIQYVKLITFIENEFPQSELKDVRGNIFLFMVPQATVRISKIFKKMRRHAFELNVESFYVSRATLSIVFSKFEESINEILRQRAETLLYAP